MSLAAQTDWAALGAVIVPVVISIIGGGLAMAWRLGALERTVKDVAADVSDLKSDMKDTRQSVELVGAKSDAASVAATTAAAAIATIARREPNTRTRETD